MSAAKIIRTFQRYILSTLLIVMGVVVVAASIELVIVVVQELLNPPLLLDLGELTRIGSLFLTVLITVELFGILEVMLLESAVHVEFVVAVALIAAAREVLVVEVTSVAPMTLVGLAALILALGAGYYLIKRAGRSVVTIQDSPALNADATVKMNRGVLKSYQARMMHHPGLRMEGTRSHPSVGAKRSRIEVNVRCIDSCATPVMMGFTKGARMTGTPRLRVNDSHSTRTPPSTCW